MIRYRLDTSYGSVDLELDGAATIARAPIRFSGPQKAVELVRSALDLCVGKHGEFLHGEALPAELKYALTLPRLQQYRPRRISANSV